MDWILYTIRGNAATLCGTQPAPRRMIERDLCPRRTDCNPPSTTHRPIPLSECLAITPMLCAPKEENGMGNQRFASRTPDAIIAAI